MAVLTLANVSSNIFGASLFYGMMSAGDTLMPQAMGAKNYS